MHSMISVFASFIALVEPCWKNRGCKVSTNHFFGGGILYCIFIYIYIYILYYAFLLCICNKHMFLNVLYTNFIHAILEKLENQVYGFHLWEEASVDHWMIPRGGWPRGWRVIGWAEFLCGCSSASNYFEPKGGRSSSYFPSKSTPE